MAVDVNTATTRRSSPIGRAAISSNVGIAIRGITSSHPALAGGTSVIMDTAGSCTPGGRLTCKGTSQKADTRPVILLTTTALLAAVEIINREPTCACRIEILPTTTVGGSVRDAIQAVGVVAMTCATKMLFGKDAESVSKSLC